MTHALSSIIGLSNAPAPPRWFEFLLEPGRLQQHLESSGCDPSPILTELSDRLYHDNGNSTDVAIPPDSYEAKYRKRKTYALQTLSVKVASFLKWDLEKLCSGLTIPIQYKLMQALTIACSNGQCPVEVKKFSQVIYCHWFLRSAISYKLSSLQPQSSSTTIIYLSELQQQQQTADHLALMSMGELFADTSKQLKDCSNELYDYITELISQTSENYQHKDGPSAKKLKTQSSSQHPFKKAKLSRPKMECFDLHDEQFNDWKQCEPVEAFVFLEAACYDLGRFFFFEESYTLAKEIFDIIKGSSGKFPLLDEYTQSASDILTPDDKLADDDEEFGLESCDILSNEIFVKRKQTEKYLFDCMTQYSESLKEKNSTRTELNDGGGGGAKMDLEINGIKKDIDYRTIELEKQLARVSAENSSNGGWNLEVPHDQQQQHLLEISKGDMFMSRGEFKQAMGCFVGALMLMSDYFRIFSKNYQDEEPYITRMIQCSISLSCYTQAVALCQMTKNLNYTIAFKQLNERICNDCCDDIYECIWNVTLLEYIINLHAKRGEMERRTKVIQLIGQLELNENNPDEILREAEHVRRGRFFRIMSNKYL